MEHYIADQLLIFNQEGVLGSIRGYVSPDALKVLQESSTVQFLIFAITIFNTARRKPIFAPVNNETETPFEKCPKGFHESGAYCMHDDEDAFWENAEAQENLQKLLNEGEC
uniref:Uncharacterized protein n=1 Tax=Acrobeloides nanus TaxID=290746 RepID=A0A914BWV0_9BILA